EDGAYAVSPEFVREEHSDKSEIRRQLRQCEASEEPCAVRRAKRCIGAAVERSIGADLCDQCTDTDDHHDDERRATAQRCIVARAVTSDDEEQEGKEGHRADEREEEEPQRDEWMRVGAAQLPHLPSPDDRNKRQQEQRSAGPARILVHVDQNGRSGGPLTGPGVKVAGIVTTPV